jgi:hypothetical protein
MTLARVRQVVYLQRDPGTYEIGNIMYNLAGRDSDTAPAAPIPVPASAVGVPHFDALNAAYATFFKERVEAGKNQNKDKTKAFFVSTDGHADFSSAITSFLCTDGAYDIFGDGGDRLDTMQLEFPGGKPPQANLTNLECLDEARRFYQYADVEGFRGSPHKL